MHDNNRLIVDQFSRMPPHDAEAEMCVLGSMMLAGGDRATTDSIRAKVREDDFFHVDNQVIWAAMLRLVDEGRPMDPMLLREDLQRRGLLDEVGGTAYLGTVVNTVPSAAHGGHYAGIVRQKAVLRRGISAANDLLRDCHAPLTSPEDGAAAIRRAAEALFQISATGTADQFVLLADAVRESLTAKQDGDVPRVPTGLIGLDDIFGGIPKSKFVLVGGRPGMGKSLICKQVALNVAARGRPVGIVTIEEDRSKIADNAVANRAKVENKRLACNDLTADEWRDIMASLADINRLPIWVNDQPSKLSEVEEAITTAAVKHKCELVVVDYLQLIDPDTGGENENREITKISKSLKRLAKRLGIGLIAACQLNRGNETGSVRTPSLRDLRGSGSLEQDGDLIILLHRPDYYLTDEQVKAGQVTGQLQAIVAKNKDGPTATVPLKFVSRHQLIRDWNPMEDTSPTGGPSHFEDPF